MKTQAFKTLLLVVFMMFFGTKLGAQTFVKPDQIGTDGISVFLKSKNYEVLEITKDFLKIQKKGSTRNIYLDFKEDKRYLMFNIAYKVVENVDKAKLDAYLKKVNAMNVIKVVYFEKGNDIQIEHYFWTKQGFSYESLQDAIDEFLLYVGDCIDDDTDKILQ